jgi:hypothetical protein
MFVMPIAGVSLEWILGVVVRISTISVPSTDSIVLSKVCMDENGSSVSCVLNKPKKKPVSHPDMR